jgi:hypothetical protein
MLPKTKTDVIAPKRTPVYISGLNPMPRTNGFQQENEGSAVTVGGYTVLYQQGKNNASPFINEN